MPIGERFERRELLAAFTVLRVPTAGSAPTGVVVTPDGAAWFTSHDRDMLGRVAPGGGPITEFASIGGTGPNGIAVGPDGRLHVAFDGSAAIGRFRTNGAADGLFATPAGSRPTAIAAGPDSALYFTDPATNKIGRITTAGVVTEAADPLGTTATNPVALTAAGDSGVWVALEAADRVVRVDPATLAVTETRTFAPGSRPLGIASAADGSLVVTLSGSNQLARVVPSPATTAILPPLAPGAAPAAIARRDDPLGLDRSLWFTEPGLARVARLNPDGTVTEFAAPADAGTLGAIAAGPSGDFFITSPTGNTITRLNPSELITVTAQPVTATAGVAVTPVVATFSALALNARPGDFQAAIDWGDGSGLTPGTVQPAAGGGFQVVGTHTYAASRTFPVVVAVTDQAGVRAVSGTATATVAAAPGDFSGALARFSDSGVSDTDGVTNVSRPTFVGTGTPLSVVQVSAVRAGSFPTETRVIGQAIVNAGGDWVIGGTTYLPDGVYTILGAMTTPGGSPSVPRALNQGRPIVIDTLAPRVAGFALGSGKGLISTVISDVGAGLAVASALNPANYTIVPGTSVAGFNPSRSPDRASSISGFYSSASAFTIQVAFAPRGLSRSRLPRFQVLSGGVIDIAGNPLDGEFRGRLPSGNGAPGGNFLVKLVTSSQPFPSRPAATARARRAAGPVR